MKKTSSLRDELESREKLQADIQATLELAEMGDESLQSELEEELLKIESAVEKLELEILFTGPYDSGNALLEVNSGAGGTDSQDWAAMLERMYVRWADENGFQCEILDESSGEEAGIKNVTMAIHGANAYGLLYGEKGVHRLVRLSPFDSAHRRHTSFAQVEVLPEAAEDDPQIQISAEDLKIDVFRSSGAGGQNVQKNSTAVRITHIPTGMVVACQNERSQLQNKENAMRVLRSRLLEIAREAHERQLAELRGEYTKTEWGSQIRSYVLHPYQMVKDHRTEFETGNTQAVLNGDLNGFMQSYLRWKKQTQ